MYVSSYLTHEIHKLRKDGRSPEPVFVEGNVKRPSDLVMAQEQKQRAAPGGPCGAAPCHASALCLVAHGGNDFTCACPDHLEPLRNHSKGSQVSLPSTSFLFKVSQYL